MPRSKRHNPLKDLGRMTGYREREGPEALPPAKRAAVNSLFGSRKKRPRKELRMMRRAR